MNIDPRLLRKFCLRVPRESVEKIKTHPRQACKWCGCVFFAQYVSIHEITCGEKGFVSESLPQGEWEVREIVEKRWATFHSDNKTFAPKPPKDQLPPAELRVACLYYSYTKRHPILLDDLLTQVRKFPQFFEKTGEYRKGGIVTKVYRFKEPPFPTEEYLNLSDELWLLIKRAKKMGAEL